MVMKGVVYCNRGCGAHNPHGVRKCQTCGMEMDTPRTNPITSAEFANRKMAVFDIDDTILDVGQRFKDAVRGGFQNKDGSIPKGKVKQRQEFLYREDILMKDRVIPGAKALIDYLMERGYVIAYCTARPFAVYEATLDQLEAKGFPIFDNPNGEPLLYCKKALGLKKPVYKSRVVKELQAQYDVRLFFDNRIETCAAIAQIDVPGVYTSINDYWKLIQGDVRDNPYYTDPKTGETVFLRDHDKYRRSGEDPDAEPYASADAHMDPSGMGSVGNNPGFYSKDMLERAFKSIKGTKIQTNPGPNMEMCGTCVYMCEKSGMCKKWSKMKGSDVYVLADWYCGAYEARPKNNPPLKPRRKKMKNGKYRKEPAKSYIQRFMGDKKMIKEFPDEGQRYAVGISYVDKIYGKSGLNSLGVVLRNGEEYSEDYMVPRDVDKLHKAADSINDTYYEGLEVPEWWKSKMSVTADQADNLSDALGYVADNPSEILKIYSGEPKSKFRNMGVVFAEVQIGRNIAKDVGEVVQSVYRGLIGGRTSMAERRMAMAIASMQKELSDRATDAGGNAIANLKLDYEMVQGTATLTIIAHADAIKMARKPKSNPPRSNPPKSKVEKGKELYKHMNGKDPAKTETKVIDMGDVWYQVGEGGCWQIGYMSGKETGSSSQKYVHHFNEETKNGDFPKLYATIPDKGKPMLIITGGTWKIKTDDQGVAWIYD